MENIEKSSRNDELSPLRQELSQTSLNKTKSQRERAMLRKSRTLGWNGEKVIPEHVTPTVPATSMYWRKIIPRSDICPKQLRAHTMNLIGTKIYLFGGSDQNKCSNDLFIFDTESFIWTNPVCKGDLPPPVRAHTATVINDDLYIFGGGSGPNYFNEIYVLNVKTHIWRKPIAKGIPPGPRRAHTACAYKNKLYIIFGGDGSKALEDVFILSIENNENISWSQAKTLGPQPTARGYQTVNLLGSKAILFGGSDGQECFGDTHILDLGSFQ
eukprot:NODE_626_length_5881_cov_0.289519.p2 type:complete len:270 gc:universal NODE_626_length_5881_cov_0.289519:4324-3515(-)